MRKKFIKLCIFLILLNLNSISYAQTFGVKTGFSITHSTFKDFNKIDNIYFNTGLSLGVTAEFLINKNLFFETDISIIKKGYRYQGFSYFPVIDENTGELVYNHFYNKDKISPIFINIPLKMKIFFTNNKPKIFGVLGPYIGIGIGGKIKGKSIYNGVVDNYDIKIKYNSLGDRIDYGLNAGIGLEINSFQISTLYELGIANTYFENYFSLTLGYKFIDLKNKQK